MKLFRNKITILIAISSLVSIGIIVFIHLYFGSSVEKIRRSYAGAQVRMLQNNVKVNSLGTIRALTLISEDQAIKPCILNNSGLPEGIDDQLAMSGFSFLIATGPGFSPIDYYPKNQLGILKMIPANPVVFSKALSDGRVTRYYQWKNDSLYEVSAIAIPPCRGSVSDSTGAWLFAARYISKELTEKLIMQLPGKISIIRPPQASGSAINQKTNTYTSILPLYGWDNIPVASLKIETQPEIMQALTMHQKSLLFVMILMTLAFMTFIYLYLSRYYILPLKMISMALRHKDPEYLRMISDNDPDFNSLQNMLINVFNQENLLSDIMKRRSTEQMNTYHAAILSRINEAVYTYDHKGIITYWNNAAENLYDISEPEAISKIANELVKNKWKSSEEERQQLDSLKTAGAWQGLLKQELPDGTEINVEASISCLYDNNNILLGYLSIVRKPYR
ncbi:MAG: PAS domain-containing protein [Bacteroidales bacterium]|nr:PAS domain-containing protein [Bacteroidales bacterium]